MKLHLNLALRRAVLAAMATMAVYTTQADETTSFPGGISNGQYLVTGTHTTSDSYNSETVNYTPDIFIGGGGEDGNLTLTGTDSDFTSSITANSVNVGNSVSKNQGTLTLTNNATVYASSQIVVGANNGNGTLNIGEEGTEGTSGQVGLYAPYSEDGESTNGPVALIVGHHTTPSAETDIINIFNGNLFVSTYDNTGTGAYVTIGSQGGKAELNLHNSSSASFYGANTIIGDKSGATGTVTLNNKSSIELTSLVLGNEKGATGIINIDGEWGTEGDFDYARVEVAGIVNPEDDSLSYNTAVIGNSGKGELNVLCGMFDAADVILGQNETGNGTIVIGKEDFTPGTGYNPNGLVNADNLVIGHKGIGSVTINTGAALGADNIILGDKATGEGTLDIKQGADFETVVFNNIYVGYEGTGTLKTASSLKTKALHVIGKDSTATISDKAVLTTGELNILGGAAEGAEKKGTVTVTEGATLAVSKIETYIVDPETGDTTTETTDGNLTIVNGGYLDVKGTATVEGDTLLDNSSSINVSGTLTTNGTTEEDANGTTVNGGTITIKEGGTWNANGSTTGLDTIANDGKLNVGGTMAAMQGITGTGDIEVAEGSSLSLAGATTQGDIKGTGSLNVYGTVSANSLSSSIAKNTTLYITSSTASGSIITLENAIATTEGATTSGIKAEFDFSDTPELYVGKTITFVEMGETQAGTSITKGLTAEDLKNGLKTFDEKKQLSFTATGDNEKGIYTSIVFNKLSEVLQEAKKEEVAVVPPTGDTTTVETIEVTLEYEKQTLTATEKKLDKFDDNADALEKAVGTASGQTLQTVVIESNQNTTGGAENIVDMVIGSGLTTSSGLTVQTVVVNQITTSGAGPNATTEEKTAGTTGMVLILDGETEIKGDKNKKDNNHLGFADEVNGQTLTATDDTQKKAQKKAQTIDLIQVNEGTSVTLSNLNMHSTHNMHVGAGTTIVFDNVSVKVGGSEDNSLKYDEVVVETANGTKTVLVENKNSAHLDIHSEFEPGAIINIANGSVVEFHHVTGTNDKGDVVYAHDDVLFDNATIVMDNLHGGTGEKKTTLGSLDEHAQVLRLENSKLSGSGLVQNFVMTGGVLKVGNSPSELSVAKGEVKGSEVRFTLVTNSDEWDNYTGTPDGTLTPTYGTGAISQVKLDGALTLNNAIIGFTYEEKSPAGTTKDYTTQTNEEGKAAMADQHLFAEGDSLTLFTGDITNLSGTFSVDYESLPTLADENLLTWDWSTLLTNGKITVVLNERLEEPWRIANTLVSAGDTVLGFGRLAETQGKLREAGTTRTWGSAIAQFDSIDSGSSTNGYDYNAWGAAVGVDHAFTKNTVVGVAFGCTWGENEPENGTDFYDGGSIDQDARMIGIYGVHKFQTKGLMNDVKLSAFAAYGWFENDSTRSSLKAPGTAKAEWDSDAWVLSASLSRDITTDSGVVFTPYVGVEYTKAGMDDFTEKGRVTTADYTADEDYSNLAVKLGVAVSKTYGKVTPYANIAFISDVDRSAAKVTATGRETITGKSALPGRNGFEIGVGATWQLSDNLDVNAGYSAEIRDKATEHNARVGIGYTF